MNPQSRTLASLLTLCTLTAACGGGGGGVEDFALPTPARGFYTLTLNNGRTGYLTILSDGTYWGLYSTVANDNVVAGLLQGSGNTNANQFTSGNGRDFNLEGLEILEFDVTATFSEMASIAGTADYGGDTVSFTGVYDDSFELTPSLAAVAGSYSGEAASSGGNETATFTVTTAGVVSGSGSSGCTFSGTLEPRTDGNVFDTTITFHGGVCVNGSQTTHGIAVYDDTTHHLDAAVLNNARDDGAIFLGDKP